MSPIHELLWIPAAGRFHAGRETVRPARGEEPPWRTINETASSLAIASQAVMFQTCLLLEKRCESRPPFTFVRLRCISKAFYLFPFTLVNSPRRAVSGVRLATLTTIRKIS